MNEERFPEMITRLPQADVPLAGVQGFVSQGPGHQVLFIELQTGAVIPPHSHGDQWGVVVHGEMDLTIGGQVHRCRPGDHYFIPAGTVHSAKIIQRMLVIDVFADANRYATKA